MNKKANYLSLLIITLSLTFSCSNEEIDNSITNTDDNSITNTEKEASLISKPVSLSQLISEFQPKESLTKVNAISSIKGFAKNNKNRIFDNLLDFNAKSNSNGSVTGTGIFKGNLTAEDNLKDNNGKLIIGKLNFKGTAVAVLANKGEDRGVCVFRITKTNNDVPKPLKQAEYKKDSYLLFRLNTINGKAKIAKFAYAIAPDKSKTIQKNDENIRKLVKRGIISYHGLDFKNLTNEEEQFFNRFFKLKPSKGEFLNIEKE